MTEVPLFPLHAVLCPGVAMPLHVFEPRYRALVRHCLAERVPFGVVLIREGREVGGGSLAVAEVGTFAEIREASGYDDGRFDIVVDGGGRFRLDRVIVGRDPYLVGVVEPLDDELGDETRARRLALSVTRRFIRYLELATPADDEVGGDLVLRLEIERPTEGAETAERPVDADEAEADPGEGLRGAGDTEADLADLTRLDLPDDDAEDEAIEIEIGRHELTIPDEPTALSHLLAGIVELDLPHRQALLEAPTTERRLAALARILDREIDLLGRRLRVFLPDTALAAVRRN